MTDIFFMFKKPHDPTFTIDAYVSSSDGIKLTPHGETLLDERLSESEKVFDFFEYANNIHMPLPLPQIDLKPLREEYHRCLDMPIRLAGETEYFLPNEWVGLQPLIENIIAQEHATNPNWVDYNTYITVDCKHVEADEQQRHGGLHVDGFQGERINPKTKINRQ